MAVIRRCALAVGRRRAGMIRRGLSTDGGLCSLCRALRTCSRLRRVRRNLPRLIGQVVRAARCAGSLTCQIIGDFYSLRRRRHAARDIPCTIRRI